MHTPTRPLSRSTPPAQIVIADDHDLARAGLRAVFDDTRDMVVVGEAADGEAALALCLQLHPSLAVLDVRMPKMNGLEATRAIKEACPRTSVLLVSFHADPEYVVEALRLGAAGYLLKDASRDQILETARRSLSGEALLYGAQAADLLRRAADSRADAQRLPAREHSPRTALSQREQQVLRLVTEGFTNRDIATQLAIKPGTVKNHIEHIIAKLGVSDRTQAAVYALRHGMLAE
jgi:DNA-binding NarL/FixJ family response regulator